MMCILNCLNEHLGLISCIATIAAAVAAWKSAKAAKKACKIAELTYDRENRECNAAKILMEFFFDGNGRKTGTLTIYNKGNACTQNLRIVSEALNFDDTPENIAIQVEEKDGKLSPIADTGTNENKNEDKEPEYKNGYYIGMLHKDVPVKIISIPQGSIFKQFFVTAYWDDDYKKGNKKEFLVWDGNQ